MLQTQLKLWDAKFKVRSRKGTTCTVRGVFVSHFRCVLFHCFQNLCWCWVSEQRLRRCVLGFPAGRNHRAAIDAPLGVALMSSKAFQPFSCLPYLIFCPSVSIKAFLTGPRQVLFCFYLFLFISILFCFKTINRECRIWGAAASGGCEAQRSQVPSPAASLLSIPVEQNQASRLTFELWNKLLKVAQLMIKQLQNDYSFQLWDAKTQPKW